MLHSSYLIVSYLHRKGRYFIFDMQGLYRGLGGGVKCASESDLYPSSAREKVVVVRHLSYTVRSEIIKVRRISITSAGSRLRRSPEGGCARRSRASARKERAKTQNI